MDDSTIEALKAANKAFQGIFDHCLSNGVFNRWAAPMDCTRLNDARHAVEAALREIEASQDGPVKRPVDELRALDVSVREHPYHETLLQARFTRFEATLQFPIDVPAEDFAAGLRGLADRIDAMALQPDDGGPLVTSWTDR